MARRVSGLQLPCAAVAGTLGAAVGLAWLRGAGPVQQLYLQFRGGGGHRGGGDLAGDWLADRTALARSA